MLITKLEPINKSKIRVYLDDEYSFFLYSSDIKKLHLEQGQELKKDIYIDIIENLIFVRAKQRALYLLKSMDRTTFELEIKLKQGGYTNEIIHRTIDYINQFGYLDDNRYAADYIRFKSASKSRKQIQMELIRKGIEKRIIDSIFESEEGNDDTAIIKAIRKKTNHIEELTPEQSRRLAASLYRKGFSADDIQRHLKVYNDNT